MVTLRVLWRYFEVTLWVLWDHFGGTQWTFCGYYRITFRVLGGHFVGTPGSLLGYSRITFDFLFGQIWEYSDVILRVPFRPFGEYPGVPLRVLWDYFWDSLGSL